MKKCDKVILILFYKNGNRECFVFNSRQDTESYISRNLERFEKENLISFEIYFGYLAENFKERDLKKPTL